MAYIEYRIDNFGLQKHLPESVKKPIHRIKTSSGIEKKTIHRIFPAIHFDPGKWFFLELCRTMKKNYFAMKTNGIGWCSSKN